MWVVEPTTEFETTQMALAPTARCGSISKKSVRIGTRNTATEAQHGAKRGGNQRSNTNSNQERNIHEFIRNQEA